MPNRILREGILTSETVNQLSEPAENLYRRLMSVVDDYGRYFGHPTLIRAACYPLKLEQVTDKHVADRLEEVASVGLATIYEVNGKKYIQLSNFGQRQRTDSKYPAPCGHDADIVTATCRQDASTVSQKSAVVGGGDGGDIRASGFDAFWSEYPKKKSKGQAEKAWGKIQPNEQLFQKIMAGLRRAKTSEEWGKDNGKYIPYPATWLNAKGWEDEYADVADFAGAK